MKYEWDEATNMLKLDRVLHGAAFYPHDYGFIPQTLCGDGDPLVRISLSHVHSGGEHTAGFPPSLSCTWHMDDTCIVYFPWLGIGVCLCARADLSMLGSGACGRTGRL